jgi:hypothetical protein
MRTCTLTCGLVPPPGLDSAVGTVSVGVDEVTALRRQVRASELGRVHPQADRHVIARTVEVGECSLRLNTFLPRSMTCSPTWRSRSRSNTTPLRACTYGTHC